MASLNLSIPVLLTYAGNISAMMCAQAVSVGSGAAVLLNPIDYSGNTTTQLWQFGSDNRIYLFNPNDALNPILCLSFSGSAQNGAPLVLAQPNALDENQQWIWTNYLSLENIGASTSGTIYMLDNNGSGTNPNNKLQLWAANGTDAQQWLTQLLLGAAYATMADQLATA
ncbi:RICIN domain-containing protein [Dyella choica]|uniref:Ricin B lectin domain-containing protein n=1 Tax=Dyella choica TaxID=1927959 RepID=A0A432M0P3_9GAMM|nr:RICIN domain-containing protein [Dyella choica]RUL70461.1 hypothetical protein EKH80_20595 [Dyella choica]